MSGAYTEQQELIPITVNLGAAVAAGTNESWMLFTVPTAVPSMHLISATLQNGANVTANATDYNTFVVTKGASTAMATLNFGATNLTADTAVSFTRTTTVADQKLTGGDTVSLVKTAVLNGTAGATSIQSILTLWFRYGPDTNAS